MKFEFYIAKRYLIAKKSKNVINIISGISIAGVMVGTAALIIVLSVFNGFESLVTSLYNSFDPDIKISAARGKTFDVNDKVLTQIKHLPELAYYSEVLEEQALLKYREQQFIATLKGTSAEYLKHSGIDTMITAGEPLLRNKDIDFALVGQGVAYNLALNVNDMFHPLTVYAAKPGKDISNLNPEEAFNTQSINVAGTFAVQQEIDIKYVLVPVEFLRSILEVNNVATSVEIGIKAGSDKDEVIEKVRLIVGEKYKVQNRYQQHEMIYKIMKSEKWAIFFILSFILIIATFNVIGTLTMLIIDKKKDISILLSMGASLGSIKKIFIFEGILITLVGATLGLIIGVSVCLLQQEFGLVPLQGSGSFIIQNYPVQMQAEDFIYVLITVLFIGFAAAYFPSANLVRNKLLFKTTDQ